MNSLESFYEKYIENITYFPYYLTEFMTIEQKQNIIQNFDINNFEYFNAVKSILNGKKIETYVKRVKFDESNNFSLKSLGGIDFVCSFYFPIETTQIDIINYNGKKLSSMNFNIKIPNNIPEIDDIKIDIGDMENYTNKTKINLHDLDFFIYKNVKYYKCNIFKPFFPKINVLNDILLKVNDIPKKDFFIEIGLLSGNIRIKLANLKDISLQINDQKTYPIVKGLISDNSFELV